MNSKQRFFCFVLFVFTRLPLPLTFDAGNGSDVNIYIVDTGINVGHVDFNSRASVAYDALGGEVS